MKWIFITLGCALALTIVSLSLVGAGTINLPNTNDPLPLSIRAKLDSLNDKRREIEWLTDKARLAGKASELPQEQQAYDELAAEANAWLNAAGQGLRRGALDEPLLTKQFDDQVWPKVRKLAETLKLKSRWLGPQRFDSGLVRVLGADIDHAVTTFGNGWEDVKIYLQLIRADDDQSKKIVLGQLDDMKWLPWTDLMGEHF